MCSDSASVSVAMMMWAYKRDVNSALGKTSKEPLSSTLATEASFNDDSNEKAFNVNNVCLW